MPLVEFRKINLREAVPRPVPTGLLSQPAWCLSWKSTNHRTRALWPLHLEAVVANPFYPATSYEPGDLVKWHHTTCRERPYAGNG